MRPFTNDPDPEPDRSSYFDHIPASDWWSLVWIILGGVGVFLAVWMLDTAATLGRY